MQTIQPLQQLNNVQKARLIHALFLNEIPSFLEYVTGLSAYLDEHADEVRAKWKDQFFSVDFWFRLSADAATSIKRYGKQLEKSSTVFADQLFDGYGAVYLNHCLSEYSKREECSPKLKIAIELFIHP